MRLTEAIIDSIEFQITFPYIANAHDRIIRCVEVLRLVRNV